MKKWSGTDVAALSRQILMAPTQENALPSLKGGGFVNHLCTNVFMFAVEP